MRKVNTNKLAELIWSSPKGKFAGAGKQVSEALGREPRSTDLTKRHQFDVEIARLEPGQTPYPFHSHGAQWEFYLVLSGNFGPFDVDVAPGKMTKIGRASCRERV